MYTMGIMHKYTGYEGAADEDIVYAGAPVYIFNRVMYG